MKSNHSVSQEARSNWKISLREKIEFVSINPNSVLYLPKMVSRRWAAPKNPVARMRNLARGVITLFRQNIVTLTKIMKIKSAKQSPPWNVRQDRVPLEDGVEESR